MAEVLKSVSVEKVENGYSVQAQYTNDSPSPAPMMGSGKKFVFSSWADLESFLTDESFIV